MIKFWVDPKLISKGIKVIMATFVVPEITKRQSSELKKHIKEVINKLDIETLLNSEILKAYQKLHKESGINEAICPAEHLLKIIQKSGNLPNINKVVDCYNIVSAETLLAIGAHDLDKINGDLKFTFTTGNEKYTPLFKKDSEKVKLGEYACMDSEKILCRMDIKQCDETKVDETTTKFLIYVQGNSATNDSYVLQALQKVCNNIVNFCNGQYIILN